MRTLVGTDGGVELHTVATVDMLLSFLISPCHAEQNHALRLTKAGLQGPFSEFSKAKGLVNGHCFVVQFLLLAWHLPMCRAHRNFVYLCWGQYI